MQDLVCHPAKLLVYVESLSKAFTRLRINNFTYIDLIVISIAVFIQNRIDNVTNHTIVFDILSNAFDKSKLCLQLWAIGS